MPTTRLSPAAAAEVLASIEMAAQLVSRSVTAATGAIEAARDAASELERLIDGFSEDGPIVPPSSFTATKELACSLQDLFRDATTLSFVQQEVEELDELVPLAVERARRLLTAKDVSG